AIGQASPEKRNFSGLDLEKRNLASGRGRTFFLTSLFIELIDPATGVLSVIAFHEKISRLDSLLMSTQ
ncbi:MAG: hypothetical protein ABSG23_16840, partial [Terriglobales bacterium]